MNLIRMRALLVCGLAAAGLAGGQTARPAAPSDGVVEIPLGVSGRRGMLVLKRMDQIIIPKIEFAEANVLDVVEFLNKVAIEADKSAGKATPVGINIIVNLRGRKNVPTVTLTARQVSLKTALRLITDMAGLEYHIEDNVVMIVPRDTGRE
jgi:hypothetical protein